VTTFYDTHAHLDYPDFAHELAEVIERAEAAGIAKIISIGTDLESSRNAIKLAEQFRNVFAVVGWHPSNVMEAPEDLHPALHELAQHPKVFNRLFVNMVKAGELGGVLEVVLTRLSEFMEKAQKIKGKVIAAMFYPVAVLVVAVAILLILMVKVVPQFKTVFEGMLEGSQLPAFTRLVLGISEAIKDHLLYSMGGIAVFVIIFMLFVRTKFGRRIFDKFKLKMPVIGPVVSKVAISRFTRTLGTLVSSGVPILQALTIVKETAGNVIIANAVNSVHESVKEGETITAPLEASGVFPPMVISMVDVGEQTGALPEMLLKIADNYDEEVDNAVAAMTSLLEPIMIVFLAVIVGSIVIAMFLPLIDLMNRVGDAGGGKKGEGD